MCPPAGLNQTQSGGDDWREDTFIGHVREAWAIFQPSFTPGVGAYRQLFLTPPAVCDSAIQRVAVETGKIFLTHQVPGLASGEEW